MEGVYIMSNYFNVSETLPEVETNVSIIKDDNSKCEGFYESGNISTSDSKFSGWDMSNIEYDCTDDACYIKEGWYDKELNPITGNISSWGLIDE